MKVITTDAGKALRPDHADEWLTLLKEVAVNYDGHDTSINSMKELVDELVTYADYALQCIRDEKISVTY